MEEVMNVVKGWEVVPEIRLFSQFFNHPLFIKAFAEIGQKYMAQEATIIIYLVIMACRSIKSLNHLATIIAVWGIVVRV